VVRTALPRVAPFRSCLWTSCADLLVPKPLQAPCEDRDESDFDERDEVLLRPFDDGVQSPVAADPAERAFHHPGDFGGNEHPVTAAGDRPDHDSERFYGLGQALAATAEIADGGSLESLPSELAQHRDDAFGVVHVGRGGVDGQWNAVELPRFGYCWRIAGAWDDG